MPTAMTDRQRVIGFALCIAAILPAVLDTDIVSSATATVLATRLPGRQEPDRAAGEASVVNAEPAAIGH
ncbi:hypothetical protein [Streptomyces sp. NBC_01618]|uniref:hypothetical protein n=1 Tax=Streptomyces sp. NBC_01618 TaxID=2975900 RepID=UPI003870BB80|nr:hypothetical protein OH735_19520 [Streptomyces sp. NBC_01618]